MRQIVNLLVLALTFLASAFLGGCSSNPRAEGALALADSLMNSRPDSALAVLDGLLADSAHLSRRQKMHCRLLRFNAINKLDTVFTAAHVAQAQTLADYFDRHGTPNEQMLAHYMLGRTYADQGETPRAIAAYNDAAERVERRRVGDRMSAITTVHDCDCRLLSRVHGQTAQLYYSQLLPDNMMYHGRLSMRYAEVAKDTMAYLASYAMLAEGYDMKNMKDSALHTLSHAYSLYKKVGAGQLASTLCCTMANICRQQKDYDNAVRYMHEYETQSGYFDECGNIEKGREIYYSCKGLLCLELSDKNAAEHYFRKLLGMADNYELKIAAFDGLQSLYAKYLDKDSLVKYDGLSDSICSIAHNEVEMEKTLQAQALYDYTRSELMASKKSHEAERFKVTLLVVCAISVNLILLLTIIHIRHKNSQALLQSKYRAEMEKLAQAQADLLSLRSEQSVSQKLLNQKEQEIKALQETAERYRHKIHTLQGYALNKRLQQAPVTLRLQQYLKHDPYQIPTFNDWRDLKILINHEIPTFYNTLKAEVNNLNDFEYDVCVLIRLQFSPANIAKFKKCSPAYITQIRKTVYQKIFKKEGRAEELDQYILSLS